MTEANVTLLGTGALASFLGARLARAGQAVTLVGTWREAIDAIAARGIVVEEEGRRWSAPARAVCADQPIAPAALVIVLVKSRQTVTAAGLAARLASRDGAVLTLQNGLGHRELLAAEAGAERVLVGIAFLGATGLGPGIVRDGGGSRIVVEQGPRASGAVAALRAAGFSIEPAEDIRPAQWLKLAANCAINPLSALKRVPNGVLLADPESRATIERAAREVGAVAAAAGIQLPCDAASAALAMAHTAARNRSSMLQDVERGVPTEIEALNGAVVLAAARLGVDVPVNRQLLLAIRALGL